MSHRIGKVLDHKYRIVRVIGVGGMGTVYEAEHIMISRHVALKILSPEFVSNPEAVERFFREAESASAIGHPNIVDIYDVGREDDETVYIVMELLKGTSLEDHIDREVYLGSSAAAAIAAQVLSALRAAHDKGIVHRDLKSGNVFLAVDTRDRHEVKLLDFGIAKIGKVNAQELGLTHDGEIMGTPAYMAPEQARGLKDVDARADIWGVGVMLYEMLTGTLPYTGDNFNELIGKILLEEPRPLLAIMPDLPLDLVAIVEKAMQKDRNKRYASAAEMLDDLIPFVESTASHLMSSVVLKTIKGIPLTPEAGDGGLSIATLGGEADSRRDPMADTSPIASQEIEILDTVPGKPRKRVLVPLALAVGISVVVVGTTLALFLGGSYDASASTAREPDKKTWSGAVGAARPGPARSVTVEGTLEPPVARQADASVQADTAHKAEGKKSVKKRDRKRKIGWEESPFD